MPVQKISVAAVQDEAESAKNANGAEKKEADVSETAPSVKSTKSTPGSKDKRRRSFNRTKSKSGISKVSSVSSGLGESRRPDTPPPQNMCSDAILAPLEVDSPGSKPVKRHRRKKDGSAALSGSSSEEEEDKRRAQRPRGLRTSTGSIASRDRAELLGGELVEEELVEELVEDPVLDPVEEELTEFTDESALEVPTEIAKEPVLEPVVEIREVAEGPVLDPVEELTEFADEPSSNLAEDLELQSVGSNEGQEDEEDAAQPENKEGDTEGRVAWTLGASPTMEEEGEEEEPVAPPGQGSKEEEANDPPPPMDPPPPEPQGDAPAPLCSDDEVEVCRICHCEGEEDMPLITPCLCTGTMRWVHAECLNTWIRSSDTICCELCMYVFIMQTELKPLSKWEGLQMSSGEVKKILVSVFFHVLSVLCMVVSVIALVKRTMDEIELGMDHDMWRTDMGRPYEINGKEQLVLEWPFWTKVTVVGFGVISSMVFGYIQWKYWKDMFRRLRAFNRIITVQNCEENHTPAPSPPTNAPANGKAESVEVPIGEASNAARAPLLVAERGVGAAVAPVESPV